MQALSVIKQRYQRSPGTCYMLPLYLLELIQNFAHRVCLDGSKSNGFLRAEFERFIQTIHNMHGNMAEAELDWEGVNAQVFPHVYMTFPDMDRFKQYLSVGEITAEIRRRPYKRESIGVTDAVFFFFWARFFPLTHA